MPSNQTSEYMTGYIAYFQGKAKPAHVMQARGWDEAQEWDQRGA